MSESPVKTRNNTSQTLATVYVCLRILHWDYSPILPHSCSSTETSQCSCSKTQSLGFVKLYISIKYCPFWLLKWGKWQLKEYKWKGPSLVGSLGLSCCFRRFLSCLSCSSRPSTCNIHVFFPHHTLFQFICPGSWAGSRAESPVSVVI
jgi:hypothetical protein